MRFAWVPLSLLLAAPLAGQRRTETCPWCEEDPEVMEAIGVVSHGPIEVGFEGGSEAIEEFFEPDPWYFLETEHVRWASDLGSQSLSTRDRKRLEPLCEELREKMPALPKRIRRLDPWLRLHLHAWRLERFYTRVQDILQVSDEDFPEKRPAEGPYMGNGRYLGEAAKFDVILHSRRSGHQDFTERFMGVRVTDSVRWHHRDPHKLVASIVCEDSDLRDDRWLYPHIVHNMAHMMLAAYKHFSFDPPVWLDVGLAHAMEREIEPESFTREGEEGTYKERSRGKDWTKTVHSLVRRDRAPSLIDLMNRHTIGELTEDEHAVCWSLTRFLIEEHPDAYAELLGAIKGQLDERGYPSGEDLLGLQREQMRALWGWTPMELEEAWRAWVLR